VTGKQAPRCRQLVSTLEATTGILADLYASRAGLWHVKVDGISSPTLNVRLIQGWHQHQCGSDRIVFRLDRRMIGRNPSRCRAHCVRARGRGGAISRHHDRGAPCAARHAARATAVGSIAGAIKHARDVLGVGNADDRRAALHDARHTRRAASIVLYGAGPRTIIEADTHNADNLRLSDLRATTIMALALADLLSGSR
jgi:hypothetical protein